MQIDGQNGKYGALLSKLKNLKVIALDCDGVLFDSRQANILFYTHIMEVVGRPPVRADQHEYIHMHPVRQSLLYLIGNDGEDFERAYAYFKTIDFEPFNGHLQQEPGLTEFLSLAKKHYRIALATNRTVSTLELLKRYNISQYFDLVVSASDVTNPKPHPEIMQRILTAFGASPGEVLYVGDSKVDEDFARATGVPFVGYKNPLLNADFHVAHFRELHFLFSENVPEPVNP
ncbi:MAG: HAD family hydrolase [Syntrophobacter sp.]